MSNFSIKQAESESDFDKLKEVYLRMFPNQPELKDCDILQRLADNYEIDRDKISIDLVFCDSRVVGFFFAEVTETETTLKRQFFIPLLEASFTYNYDNLIKMYLTRYCLNDSIIYVCKKKSNIWLDRVTNLAKEVGLNLKKQKYYKESDVTVSMYSLQ